MHVGWWTLSGRMSTAVNPAWHFRLQMLDFVQPKSFKFLVSHPPYTLHLSDQQVALKPQLQKRFPAEDSRAIQGPPTLAEDNNSWHRQPKACLRLIWPPSEQVKEWTVWNQRGERMFSQERRRHFKYSRMMSDLEKNYISHSWGEGKGFKKTFGH